VRGSRIAGREVPPSDPPREAAQEIVSSWFEPISQPTAATEAPAGEEFGSAARRATTPSPAPAESEPAARTADVNIASGDALHLAAAADSGDESSATGTANQTTSPAAPSAPATDSSSIETDIEQVVDSDAQESPSQTWLAAEHIVSEAPSQAQTSPSNDTPAGYTPPVDPAPIATVPSNVVNPEPVAAHRPAKPSRLPRLARIPNNPVTGARVTGQAAVASSRLAEIASVDRLTSHPPVDYATNPEDPPTRNRMTAIALGAVVIFGWVGWQLLTSSFQSSSEVPTAIVVTPMTSLPAPSPTPSGPTSIAITSAVPFDPFGDNTENEAESAAAIDGDAQTVWHTVVYKAGNLGGKPGVGLLLDLGSKQKITTVDLTFEAAGLDATIYVSKSATPDVKTDKVLGTITNSNNTETVTADKAIKGQYVLVWITGVPQTASGGYQGGVAEVTVAGE
jgi:hypothetical protein